MARDIDVGGGEPSRRELLLLTSREELAARVEHLEQEVARERRRSDLLQGELNRLRAEARSGAVPGACLVLAEPVRSVPFTRSVPLAGSADVFVNVTVESTTSREEARRFARQALRLEMENIDRLWASGR